MYRLAVVVTLAVLAGISHAAQLGPIPMDLEIGKAYIPIGFDDNDTSQVVIHGFIPNTCYRLGPAEAKVDKVTSSIFIHQQGYLFPGRCGQLMIPFTQTVDLGILEEDNYTVWDQTTGKSLGSLLVSHATSHNIDDFLYANVSDARVQPDPASGKPMIHLDVSITDRCTIYQETQVHYYPDVIVVQPILRSTGHRCTKSLNSFSVNVPLKDGLKGTYLLHVRSMSGQALNKLVDIE